jgi:hypothetical protein
MQTVLFLCVARRVSLAVNSDADKAFALVAHQIRLMKPRRGKSGRTLARRSTVTGHSGWHPIFSSPVHKEPLWRITRLAGGFVRVVRLNDSINQRHDFSISDCRCLIGRSRAGGKQGW